MGQNPGTNAPRMLTPLEKAKRKGTKIIAINPLIETGLVGFKDPQSPRDLLLGGEKLTDQFLQIRINADLALLKAICKLLLVEEQKAPGTVFDHAFIQQYTAGYDEFINSLGHFELDDLVGQTGVSLAEIQQVVDAIKHTRKVIICWAMGLTQHKIRCKP